jgi:hypothetical protein
MRLKTDYVDQLQLFRILGKQTNETYQMGNSSIWLPYGQKINFFHSLFAVGADAKSVAQILDIPIMVGERVLYAIGKNVAQNT